MDTILELKNISFAYSDERLALDSVNVKINKGERIAILGNNGAGKSTFFLICNGILEPETGELFHRGNLVTRKKQDLYNLRKSVGIVFQDAENQIIASTVESEVSFGPMNLGLPKDEVINRVDEALDRMDLTEFKKRAPQYLSGGEKQRVSIADILAMHPDIILLDEPTASLDAKNVALLEKTLDELSNSGITLLISCHDIEFAYRFANRAIVFSNGQIIADDDIDNVFENSAVMQEAKLQKPILYNVTKILEKKLNTKFNNIPRDISQFENMF